jgi:ABC-2 type transport system permease protein
MSVLRRVVTRTSAFLVKETAVALGQPRLLLSVILGPFLLLLLFAAGFTGNANNFDTVLVVPNRPNIPTTVSTYQHFFFFSLHLVGVTTDQQQALQQLRKQQIDAVVVAPPNPLQDLANNKPANFQVYYNTLDPVESQRLNGLVYAHTRELNTIAVTAVLSGIFQAAGVQTPQQSNNTAVADLRQSILSGDSTGALSEIDKLLAAAAILRISGETLAGTAGSSPQLTQFQTALQHLAGNVSAQAGLTPQQQQDLNQLQSSAQQLPNVLNAASRISPARLAAPTDYTLTDVAPSSVDFTHYYAPIVIVLLLEHIGITLAALSVVRERTRGTTELFAVAPVRLSEILTGKALSFALILAIISAILIVLMVFALGVPFLGTVGMAVLILALLIVISVAIGFCLAAISQTETQTVQLAMLVLLFAVFFGGLFVPLYALDYPVRAIAYIVPVTEAGDALRTVLLRGNTVPIWELAALGGMAAFFIPLAFLLMRRSFSTR